MERRPELLSSVKLRQNPHNVHEWHKRVKLFEGQPARQIVTFTEAVTTVDVDKVRPASTSCHWWVIFCLNEKQLSKWWVVLGKRCCKKHPLGSSGPTWLCHLLCELLLQAVGKPHTLWTAFARFYERHGDVPNARIIFEKATQVLAMSWTHTDVMGCFTLNLKYCQPLMVLLGQ